MVDQITIFAYVLANSWSVAVCTLLAGLSFFAYYRSPGQRSYRFAGLGFAFIGLASLGESTYTFIVPTDYILSSSEFLLLQASEEIIGGVGLGLLFLAITQHKPGSSETANAEASGDQDNYWKSGMPFDD